VSACVRACACGHMRACGHVHACEHVRACRHVRGCVCVRENRLAHPCALGDTNVHRRQRRTGQNAAGTKLRTCSCACACASIPPSAHCSSNAGPASRRVCARERFCSWSRAVPADCEACSCCDEEVQEDAPSVQRNSTETDRMATQNELDKAKRCESACKSEPLTYWQNVVPQPMFSDHRFWTSSFSRKTARG
jgi:hypothetical protein